MSACTDGKNSLKCGGVLRSNSHKMGRLLKRKTRKSIHIVAVLQGCLFMCDVAQEGEKFMWTDLLLRDFWWRWFSSLQQQWNAENHGIFC